MCRRKLSFLRDNDELYPTIDYCIASAKPAPSDRSGIITLLTRATRCASKLPFNPRSDGVAMLLNRDS